MRIATFNVNGIRARLPLLLSWLALHRPHILALQETKVQDQDFPQKQLADLGYHCSYWGQKSYNGVAVLSLTAPDQLRQGLPGFKGDEARFMAGLFDGIWVINSYVPQGRAVDDPAFAVKLDYLTQVKAFVAEYFKATDHLIWLGDLNVALGPLDVYDPEKMDGQVCYHPQERSKIAAIMELGLHDLFREMHPETRQYTFWDYRLRAGLSRNLGWRIDHMMVSKSVLTACRQVWVDTEPRKQERPSDHTPVVADIAWPAT